MFLTMVSYGDFLFFVVIGICNGQGTGVCSESASNSSIICCGGYFLENNICAPCPDGFYGTNCSLPCPIGFFGSRCLQNCDCDNCSHIYGCIDGPTDTGSVTESTKDRSDAGRGILTRTTWMVLGSTSGLVILISVVSVTCLLCRKINGKNTWEPTTSTYHGESSLEDHFSPNTTETCTRSSSTVRPITDSEYNSSIDTFQCDPSNTYAGIPGDQLSDIYVEETEDNVAHLPSTRRQFSSFRATKKNMNTFTADIDDKYTMVNLANTYDGNNSIANNNLSANSTIEDHAYFVLEATNSIREKSYDGPSSIDDLPPPRFSVLGE